MKKPDFFIVGAPRSGTTSLFSYLKEHPDIFMCVPKEPHYFCKDLYADATQFYRKNWFHIFDERTYSELFSKCEEVKIAGEASTTYLYSKVAAKEIYKFNPEAKIIIILREPVGFLHSWHSYVFNCYEENIKDFKTALESEDPRKQGLVELPKLVKHPSRLYYSEMAKFSDQVQRYIDVFPREQIKIIIFDELKNDVEKVYVDILDFLNVSSSYMPDFTVQNPNEILRFPLIGAVLRNNLIVRIKNAIPRQAKTYKFFSLLFNKLNTKAKPRTLLDNTLREQLMNDLKSEVALLSEITKRDLMSLWGYK